MAVTEAMERRILTEQDATVSIVVNGVLDDSAKSGASKSPRSSPADAFAKISRAVRLAINLGTKADASPPSRPE